MNAAQALVGFLNGNLNIVTLDHMKTNILYVMDTGHFQLRGSLKGMQVKDIGLNVNCFAFTDGHGVSVLVSGAFHHRSP